VPAIPKQRIFISYRRDDSKYPEQLLYERLAAAFGEERARTRLEIALREGPHQVRIEKDGYSPFERTIERCGLAPEWCRRAFDDGRPRRRLGIECDLQSFGNPVRAAARNCPYCKRIPRRRDPLIRYRSVPDVGGSTALGYQDSVPIGSLGRQRAISRKGGRMILAEGSRTAACNAAD
jgi:hypothetical protein